MILSSLLNDKIRKELNLVFVLASNGDGGYLDIDKFYVNAEEYAFLQKISMIQFLGLVILMHSEPKECGLPSSSHCSA